MRNYTISFLSGAVGLALAGGSLHASIVDYTAADDGDGVLVCQPIGMTQPETGEYLLDIKGNHKIWDSGHVVGTFGTDTPLDPNVTLWNSIDNDTSFAWTAYNVDISMNYPFTLSLATALMPGDWSAQILSQPAWDGTTYMGHLAFTAGTPVGVGETIEFKYRMSFSGSTSYSYTQQLTPVPEPMGLGFLMLGGLALIRRR